MAQNLNKDFFDELKKEYPEAVEHFLNWLEEYKKEIGWLDIFQGGIKFHDLPYDMQNGILARFDIEKFHGKNGYQKIKTNESTRYISLFADIQRSINNRSIKLN